MVVGANQTIMQGQAFGGWRIEWRWLHVVVFVNAQVGHG